MHETGYTATATECRDRQAGSWAYSSHFINIEYSFKESFGRHLGRWAFSRITL